MEPLKRFYWEVKDEIGRFNYINAFLMKVPGHVGEKLRSYFIPRYFAVCGTNLLIQENVRFRGIHKLKVGDNVCLGVDSFIQASGGVVLGSNVLLGPGVKIWSVNHVSDDIDQPISAQGYIRKEVKIGDGCWLGANVFVMPGVSLPEGCVVSAGSVVGVKKYPPFSLIAGNPARVIGNRKTVK